MNNVGSADRIIRLLVAALAGAIGYSLGGALAWVGYAAAAIMLVTAAVGFCPIYKLVGIRTCGIKKSH